MNFDIDFEKLSYKVDCDDCGIRTGEIYRLYGFENRLENVVKTGQCPLEGRGKLNNEYNYRSLEMKGVHTSQNLCKECFKNYANKILRLKEGMKL